MNYQKIYSFDTANGPGVRVSLFVSGCTHHCKGCFNPEAWSFCSGKEFTKKEFKQIKKLLKDKRYDGLSLLGGEPFQQDKKGIKTLIKLCKYAHRKKKTVWAWSGYTYEEIRKIPLAAKLLIYCDVLVDGRFEEELYKPNLTYRGSTNQRVINLF